MCKALQPLPTSLLDGFSFAIVDDRIPPGEQSQLLATLGKHISSRQIIVLTDDSKKYTATIGYGHSYWRRSNDVDRATLRWVVEQLIAAPECRISRERNRPAFTNEYDLRYRLLVVDDDPQRCS